MSKTPCWDMILNHLGKGVQVDDWTKARGLHGRVYLEQWIASCFQRPFMRLPYLMLTSEQNKTGKSILHEALSFVLPTQRLDGCLRSAYFHGDLIDPIVGVIEDYEKPTSGMEQRLKTWVTKGELTVDRQAQAPITIKNKLHWIHCTDKVTALPFPFTEIIVNKRPDPVFPKRDLIPSLQREAPDFIGKMLTLEPMLTLHLLNYF